MYPSDQSKELQEMPPHRLLECPLLPESGDYVKINSLEIIKPQYSNKTKSPASVEQILTPVNRRIDFSVLKRIESSINSSSQKDITNTPATVQPNAEEDAEDTSSGSFPMSKAPYEKQKSKANQLPDIDYNRVSGIGYINVTKRFQFDPNSPEYGVFTELVANLNKQVKREKILALMGITNDNSKQIRRDNTLAIDEIRKKMRRKTGLNKDTLSTSKSNLILIGKLVD